MIDPNKHWWAQAEGVVGFYNAYQVSGEQRFADEAYRVWEYIEEKIVDRVHGEWHAKLKTRRDALQGGRGWRRVPGRTLEMPVPQQPGML